jgi:hypothetical protein
MAPVGPVLDELEETGLGRSYLAALDVTEDQATYGLPPTERVVVYLSEHENAEGAEAGFALREEERDPAAEDLDDVEAFGDESEVTRFVGETDDGELAFTGLDLTTRVDRLYGGVQLINYAPAGDEVEEPELETLEALGSLLVERLEAGLDGAGPGLSAQIVRLTQTDAPTIIAFDYYEVIDGEVVIPVGHTDELIALLEEEVEEYDITARYRVDQYVQVDPEEMQIPVDPYMVLRVSRFADEDQAAAWVDESLERLSSAPHFSDIEAIDDAEPLGDRSVTATYLYEFDDETTLTGHAINVQVGDIGFSLQVDVGSLAGTTEIAEAQLECLDSGACLELLEVPENLATSD